MDEASTPPHETLYVNNLNDRIKPDALKRALIPLFGRFGKIIDLVAMKSLWRKGQAWVVYENPAVAAKAMAALQGHQLYSKPMRIAFSKTPSDATLKRKQIPITREKKPRMTAEESAAKLVERTKSTEDFFKPSRAAPKVPQYTSIPNRTLFVENLPADLPASYLEDICKTIDGYEETRIIAGRGVAFIDFHFDYQAARAMQSINGKQVGPGFVLKVSYAKK